MEITNKKIELNGLIHKGVDKILILMAILSIVYGVAFTLLEKIPVARTISAFCQLLPLLSGFCLFF